MKDIINNLKKCDTWKVHLAIANNFISSIDNERVKSDKKQKTATNSINKKGDKCFQYAVTVTLNHEETGKNPERITKIKPFLNKNKIMNFKKMEKNNVTIALKVLYVKKKNISYLCFNE